jgi:hypothetical protein
MTLHPIPSEFPYICGKIYFIFFSVEHPLFQPEGAGDDGGDHGARQPEAGALPPPLPRLGHCILLPLARYCTKPNS